MQMVFSFAFFIFSWSCLSASLGLTISPWFGNSLGGVPVSVSGPTFEEDDNVTCLFGEIEREGAVVSSETAWCSSPGLLSKAGTHVEFRVKINNKLYSTSASFYPVSLEDSGDVEILNDTLLFSQDEKITINWDPVQLRQSVNNITGRTGDVEVNIKVCEMDEGNRLNEIGVVASRLPNTGSATVSLSEIDPYYGVGNDIHVVFLQLFVRVPPSPVVSKQISLSLIYTGHWTRFIFIRNVVFSELRKIAHCLLWTATEPDTSVGQEMLEAVRREFPCPLTLDLALNEGTLEPDDRFIGVFHPKASNCFRQRDGLELRANGYGNQCCYKGNNLIIGPSSGGTVDKVAPAQSKIAHFLEDVIPFFTCCPELCDEYYKRRPSDDGTAYVPPGKGFMFGDPHIVTLDLYKYTFNGKGEFILIQTNDNSFTVQGRMVEATGSSDSLVSATVLSAIVAKQDTSDTVQVELYNKELVILVNGKKTDFSELKEQKYNNVIIYDFGNGTIAVLFSKGEFIKVVNKNGFLSNMVISLPKSYKGKTSGLMGTYNGDKTDDLIPRGTSTSLATDSSTEIIHEDFGLTWIVSDPTESLFKYLFGLEWAMFYAPGFTPTYVPVFYNSNLAANASNICHGDVFCLFDIATTGRVEIGMSTLQGAQSVETLVELSKPVICNPHCVNGACVANNTCFCFEGYIGDLCDEMVYTECGDNLCQNNGSCRMHASYIVCECPPQYEGAALCEEECVYNPCLNGGTCQLELGTYVCECNSYHIGDNCETLKQFPSTANYTVFLGFIAVLVGMVIISVIACSCIAIIMRQLKKRQGK